MLTQAFTAYFTMWNTKYAAHTYMHSHKPAPKLWVLLSNFSLPPQPLSWCLSFSRCHVFVDSFRCMSAGVVHLCVCVREREDFGWLLKAELWIFHDVWCSDMRERERERWGATEEGESRRGGRWAKEGGSYLVPLPVILPSQKMNVVTIGLMQMLSPVLHIWSFCGALIFNAFKIGLHCLVDE